MLTARFNPYVCNYNSYFCNSFISIDKTTILIADQLVTPPAPFNAGTELERLQRVQMQPSIVGNVCTYMSIWGNEKTYNNLHLPKLIQIEDERNPRSSLNERNGKLSINLFIPCLQKYPLVLSSLPPMKNKNIK